MKQHLLASAALLLGAATFAMPAGADVFVRGTVTKIVTIDVDEFLIKIKEVDIDVANVFTGGTAAESTGVFNQRTDGNRLTQNCVTCRNTPYVATINLSFNDNTGVVMWNQDVGNNSNQANTISAAVITAAFFAESQAAAEQQINGNTITLNHVFPLVTKEAVINASVNRNVGVTMLNQNVGFASNQLNSLVLALGINGANNAISEADLGQWNSGNTTNEVATTKVVTIAGSVIGNRGVTLVNQNAGNFNNQATIISFAGGGR